MTAPLTPPDCDLQDFSFMPLQVSRLRDSDLAATATPEACWYAVLLWAASWHQVPAASLPDDDAVLARLIGLGRDVKTFRKHKAQAMHRFVLCDDGRLYHPVVAEQALEAWEKKWQQRWRTECARIKKANQRNGTDIPTPTYETFRAGADPVLSPICPAPVPEDNAMDVSGDIEECPSGQMVQGTGTGTGTGKLKIDIVPPVGETLSAKVRRREYPADFDAVWNTYPHHAGRSSKPDALAEWLRLPQAERDEMPACVARFFRNVEAACGGKGAPCMARWLKHGKHLNWRDGGVGVVATKPEAVAEDPWPNRLRAYRQNGYWNRLEWGPAPGKAGCTVAPEALITAGYVPTKLQEQAA